MSSVSFEVCSWCAEQVSGTRITTKFVCERLPQYSPSNISSAIHYLYRCGGITRTTEKEGKCVVYLVTDKTARIVSGMSFHDSPAGEVKRKVKSRKRAKVVHETDFTTMLQSLSDRLLEMAQEVEDMKTSALESIPETDLWREIQRRRSLSEGKERAPRSSVAKKILGSWMTK